VTSSQENDKPETVRVTRNQGRDIRAIGSDTTEEEKRGALGKVADALREKNKR
jgi:hypothetical protein